MQSSSIIALVRYRAGDKSITKIALQGSTLFRRLYLPFDL